MTKWYDTQDGLEARLHDLDGLSEIARERHKAGYDRGERMGEWVLLGRFHLDACGNFYRIFQGAPADASSIGIPRVMARSQMEHYTEQWSSSPFHVPIERCSMCGHGWTLDNVHTCHWFQWHPNQVPRHQRCQRLHLAQESYEDLGDIVRRSEISVCSKRLIPNEYDSDDDLYYGPWLLVETPLGRIRMGWRKRVISIDWKESTLRRLDVGKIFADEDVTKWETGIHAWSEDKAVEYLRKAWAHGNEK